MSANQSPIFTLPPANSTPVVLSATLAHPSLVLMLVPMLTGDPEVKFIPARLPNAHTLLLFDE